MSSTHPTDSYWPNIDELLHAQYGRMNPCARPPSILYGPSSPVPLQLTFSELLDYQAEVRPETLAVISHPQGRSLSFKQLRETSLLLAKRMREDGIRRGDKVAIIAGNRVEYFEVGLLC